MGKKGSLSLSRSPTLASEVGFEKWPFLPSIRKYLLKYDAKFYSFLLKGGKIWCDQVKVKKNVRNENSQFTFHKVVSTEVILLMLSKN